MKIRPIRTHRMIAPPIINHLLVRGLVGLMANTDHLWDTRNKYANPAPIITQKGRRNKVFKLHLDPQCCVFQFLFLASLIQLIYKGYSIQQ